MIDVKQDLQLRYDTFINREQRLGFFKGLAEYLDYVFLEPILKSTFEAQIARRDSLYKKIDEIESLTLQELEVSKIKLLESIKNKKIDTSAFKSYSFYVESTPDVVKQLESFEKGESGPQGGFRSDAIQSYLFNIAVNISHAGYAGEVKDFLVSDSDYQNYYRRVNGNGNYIRGEYGNFIFSKTWPERFETTALISREQSLKPWGAFERLYHFRRAYNDVSKNVDLWYLTMSGKEKSEFNTPLKAHLFIDIVEMEEDVKIFMGENPSGISKYAHSYSLHEKIRRLHIQIFKPIAQTVHNILTNVAEQEREVGKIEPQTERLSDVKEPIKMKTLGIEVSGNYVSRKTNGNKFKINDTDKWLIYFLHYKSISNKNECFKTDRLAIEMGPEIGKKTEKYIKNRIVTINKEIKELIVQGKTSIGNFIKNERGRGYRLNPKVEKDHK